LQAPNEQHAGYRILLPELRGHGRSGRSDGYAMPNFLLDLHTVIEQLDVPTCALFGHSLGGHIVTKFAALFPERITSLLVVEGLGPPRRPHEGDPVAELQAYRHMLLQRGAPALRASRALADLQDATDRLRRNNPRLSAPQAADIAGHLVETVHGELKWAFDPRANSVFIGASNADNVRFWRQVTAPTCVISGALSYEYWGREMASPNFDGHFAAGEMEARAANFIHHEHHWFEQSGHMIHYDEPDRLGTLCRHFLEQNHV